MDKETARAIGLVLAFYLAHNSTLSVSQRFEWAGKFANYITNGYWPKEAVNQLGQEEEGSEEGSNETL